MTAVRPDFLATLSEMAGSAATMDDAHARLHAYRMLLEGDRLRDEDHVDRVFSLLREEPDRALAAGVVGEVIDENAPHWLIVHALEALPDSKFVRRRADELAALVAHSSQDSVPTSELDNASGWLEEKLAERSKSAAVLTFLAERATRRAARRVAATRLRQIEARRSS